MIYSKELTERSPLRVFERYLADFDAAVTAQTDEAQARSFAALELDPAWEVLLEGKGGKPLRARRTVGKGRVAICDRTLPWILSSFAFHLISRSTCSVLAWPLAASHASI